MAAVCTVCPPGGQTDPTCMIPYLATLERQTKDKGAYFGSWFEDAVHYGGRSQQQGFEIAGSTASTDRKFLLLTQ